MQDAIESFADFRRLVELHSVRCWTWSAAPPRPRIAAVIVPKTENESRPLAAQSTIWGPPQLSTQVPTVWDALRQRLGDSLTIHYGRGIAQFVEPTGIAGTVEVVEAADWPARVCQTRAAHEDLAARYRAGLRRAGLVMQDGVLCSTATRRRWTQAPADDPDALWRLAMDGPCEP